MLTTGFYSAAHVTSRASPSPLFILASSVCWSLKCLISTLTQGVEVVTYLGSLVQSCCGEGGILQANITGMCGERAQCLGRPGFGPAHGMCAFPTTLLRLQVALLGNGLRRALGCVHSLDLHRSSSGSRVLHRGTDSVGPQVCALPRSEQLRRPGAWPAHTLQGRCVLSPPSSQPLGFLGP